MILLQRFAQIGIQPQIFKYALVHLAGEHAEFAAPVLFSVVHRGIGVTNQTFAIFTMQRGEGDTNRAAAVDFDQPDTERLTQPLQNA